LENLCICYFSGSESLFVAKIKEIQDLFWKTCKFAATSLKVRHSN